MNGIFIPQGNTVALYNSDNELENEPPQKKLRVQKEWTYEQTFSSKEEADKFLTAGNWSYHYQNRSENGVRITYRCSNHISV